MWVLTGDKLETAVNIAYACRLLSNAHARVTISTEALPGVQEAEQRGDMEAARRAVKEGVLRQLTDALAAHTYTPEPEDPWYAGGGSGSSRSGWGLGASGSRYGGRADTVVSHADLLLPDSASAGGGAGSTRSGRFGGRLASALGGGSGSSRLSRRFGGPLALVVDG